VDAIMTAHVMFPAIEPDPNVPATLSKAVLTDLLRTEMGFQGAVISDCLEMAAIAEGVGVVEGALATLAAGTDIVLVSHHEERQQAAIAAVIEAAMRGVLSRERIEQAVARVQRLKESAAVRGWRELPAKPEGLMRPDAVALAKRVQRAALRVDGAFRPLNRHLPVALITFEVRSRSEIDEVALARNKEARSSMLSGLQQAGFDVREFALSAEALDAEIAEALAFTADAQQIVVQSYNAMLVEGQRRFIAAMATIAAEKLWLVAGRLPYDLDLVPTAQGRVAAYGCRPPALEPVIEKLAGN